MKQHIPNLLTLCNLLSGCISIGLAAQGQYVWAAYFIFIGAGFDVLDGLAARMLGVTSGIGSELDSLADVVTFGVAPGFLIAWTLHSEGLSPFQQFQQGNPLTLFIQLEALLIPAFTALRLARFNVQPTRGPHFQGLPAPANGLFWACMVLALPQIMDVLAGMGRPDTFSEITKRLGVFSIIMLYYQFTLVVLIPLLCYLMMSRVPFVSLKLNSTRWADGWRLYCTAGVTLVCVLFMGWMAALPALGAYWLFSVKKRTP